MRGLPLVFLVWAAAAASNKQQQPSVDDVVRLVEALSNRVAALEGQVLELQQQPQSGQHQQHDLQQGLQPRHPHQQEQQEEQERRKERPENGGWWWHWILLSQSRFMVIVLVHEVWVALQHLNVLLNPWCQRLDRRYGISLLKKRKYWVIAGVLGAYWLREMLSMIVALPYASSTTTNMVAISCLYHTGKIIGISIDARRGWSPPLGIMRLLIDHWHLGSVGDMLVTVKRFTLQAYDSLTHVLIVRDMLRWAGGTVPAVASGQWDPVLERALIFTILVWSLHALGNILTGLSTATIMVRTASAIVGPWKPKGGDITRKCGGALALDDGRGELTCSPQCAGRHAHGKCEVCHLLTRDMPLPARCDTQRQHNGAPYHAVPPAQPWHVGWSSGRRAPAADWRAD